MKSAKTRNATVFTDYSNHEARPSIPLRARNHPAPSIFYVVFTSRIELLRQDSRFEKRKETEDASLKIAFPTEGISPTVLDSTQRSSPFLPISDAIISLVLFRSVFLFHFYNIERASYIFSMKRVTGACIFLPNHICPASFSLTLFLHCRRWISFECHIATIVNFFSEIFFKIFDRMYDYSSIQ